MADDVVNIEALLAPLGGEGGAGEDLRNDFSPASPYQKLRDSRNDARAEERAQDAEGGNPGEAPPVPAAWREVKRVGIASIAEKSKDLEIAAWTTEALMRLDGLPGLAAGAKLIAGLLDRYWEPAFPRPDEEGLEVRGAPLGGLAGEGGDGTLMQPIRRLALFRRGDGSAVSLHLYKQAEDTDAIGDEKRKKARIDAGMPAMSALEAEAKLDAAHLRQVGIEARAAGQAWATMDAALSARFGADAPATRRVAEALALIVETAEKLIGPLPAEAAAAAPGEETEVVADDAAAPGVAGAAGVSAGPRALRTREDAIRQLEDLADWFRRTEPHSPLAFTLEDAVRRARMPLPDLLAEVLPDAKARSAMLSMLGIKPPAAEG